jgi:hypothetical protein
VSLAALSGTPGSHGSGPAELDRLGQAPVEQGCAVVGAVELPQVHRFCLARSPSSQVPSTRPTCGSVAESDHEPIQVIALRDRVPAHPGRAGRHDIMGQEPVQEDVTLQNREWPARAPVVAIAEAQ